MNADAPKDFWWLPTADLDGFMMGAGHHQPIDDEYEPSWADPDPSEPTLEGWFHSKNGTTWSNQFRWYPLGFAADWIDQCHGKNAYRTMRIVHPGRTDPVIGPFLIDIDNQSEEGGYSSDLEAAHEVARQATTALTPRGLMWNTDFRLFFSGRKGFNIEVEPSRLGIVGDEATQIRESAEILEELRDELSMGDTVIDRIYGDRFGYRLRHPYIRLHESWNCWKSADSQPKCRRRASLSVERLMDSSTEEIVAMAELPEGGG